MPAHESAHRESGTKRPSASSAQPLAPVTLRIVGTVAHTRSPLTPLPVTRTLPVTFSMRKPPCQGPPAWGAIPISGLFLRRNRESKKYRVYNLFLMFSRFSPEASAFQL